MSQRRRRALLGTTLGVVVAAGILGVIRWSSAKTVVLQNAGARIQEGTNSAPSGGDAARGSAGPVIVHSPQLGDARGAFRANQADSEENVARFGEFVWPAVKNESTLFFHGGQYIDSPHEVRTRGLAILVNGKQVNVVEWPDATYLAERPDPPAGISEESTPHDLVNGRRLNDSWPIQLARWANNHFKRLEDREEQLIEAYKRLPFVAEVGRRFVDDSFVGKQTFLWFRTNTGEEKGIPSHSVGGFPPKPPEIVLEQDVLHMAGRYREAVESGQLEFRQGNAMARIPKGSRAWLWLPEVLEVLDSDSTSANKERKLHVLLNAESGVEGAVDRMISTWAVEFRPSAQLRDRIQRIREERTRAPNWKIPPPLPTDVAEPAAGVEVDSGGDENIRENLDAAIVEMIQLLEGKDFKTFVERYVQPRYRSKYNYPGNTQVDPTGAYDFEQQPQLVEMYLNSLRHAQMLEPILDGNEAIFTHWFGRGPTEKRFVKVGQFWYFR